MDNFQLVYLATKFVLTFIRLPGGFEDEFSTYKMGEKYGHITARLLAYSKSPEKQKRNAKSEALRVVLSLFTLGNPTIKLLDIQWRRNLTFAAGSEGYK